MYHHLMAFRPNLGYYINCADEKQSADLLDKFNEVTESDDLMNPLIFTGLEKA